MAVVQATDATTRVWWQISQRCYDADLGDFPAAKEFPSLSERWRCLTTKPVVFVTGDPTHTTFTTALVAFPGVLRPQFRIEYDDKKVGNKQPAGNYLVPAYPGLIVKDCYWRWPQRNLAGNSIDFFVRVLGLSFHDAMRQIIGP